MLEFTPARLLYGPHHRRGGIHLAEVWSRVTCKSRRGFVYGFFSSTQVGGGGKLTLTQLSL
jgi:hypothetical protein